ncbi:sigma-70 family RNA polymerase sigma factor [Candidatus Poribacteria bacterium]
MRTEDGYIVQKCLNGEPEAFGLLVDKYKASIYAFAYVRLRNFHDAEDVAQDVFVQAYRKLGSLRRWDSFLPWLYSIASDLCRRWTRSQARRPDREFIEDQNPEMREGTSANSHREDMVHESLHEALDSLPEAYQQVITLHYLGGMNSREIARFLGMSPTAIRKRLSRARAQLKEEMLTTMDTAFEGQRLQASFTFHIIETVRRIKINPMPRAAGLPWGLSLAAGIIFAVMSLSPYLNISNMMAVPAGLPLPAKAKVRRIGEISVEVLDISHISSIASKQVDEDNKRPELPRDTLLLAPQAADGKWTRKSDMPVATITHASSVVDGKIYAVGGMTVFPAPSSTVEEYDPETDEWTKKTDMPTARNFLAASALNGKIYAIGGWGWGFSSTVEEYDPETDKWTKKANMPTARDGLSTCVADGRIYVIGGVSAAIKPLQTVEEYDPVTDTWTKKANMPTARWGHSTGVMNGRIYVIGGRIGTGEQGPAFPTVEEYDPVTDTWTKKTDMPTARWGLSANVVNGRIYAIGGSTDERTGLSVVEVYDPVTDKWTKNPDMPTARWYFSASVANGKIYTIGGATAAGVYTSTVEEYDPEFVSGEAINAEGKLPTTWGTVKRHKNIEAQ